MKGLSLSRGKLRPLLKSLQFFMLSGVVCPTCSVKDEHAGVVEVEMRLDAFRFDVVASVLLKSSRNSRDSVRCQIQIT